MGESGNRQRYGSSSRVDFGALDDAARESPLANRRSRIKGGHVHKLNNTLSFRVGKNRRI
jgi:hypothetical protein